MTALATDIARRTAEAVKFGCRCMATDLATLLDALPQPDDPKALAYQIEDATDTYLRALSYSASYVYGLCLFSCRLPDDAGKMFRRDDVQMELRASAMRVAMSVMTKE